MGCDREVASSCFTCGCLLCMIHFIINISCATHLYHQHGKSQPKDHFSKSPEGYEVEGSNPHVVKAKNDSTILCATSLLFYTFIIINCKLFIIIQLSIQLHGLSCKDTDYMV